MQPLVLFVLLGNFTITGGRMRSILRSELARFFIQNFTEVFGVLRISDILYKIFVAGSEQLQIIVIFRGSHNAFFLKDAGYC